MVAPITKFAYLKNPGYVHAALIESGLKICNVCCVLTVAFHINNVTLMKRLVCCILDTMKIQHKSHGAKVR